MDSDAEEVDMKREKILDLLNAETEKESVLVKGWVRTRRDSKTFSFIELNDGSCLKNMQIIAPDSLEEYPDVRRITTGSAVAVTGRLVASQGKGQKWEVQAEQIRILACL